MISLKYRYSDSSLFFLRNKISRFINLSFQEQKCLLSCFSLKYYFTIFAHSFSILLILAELIFLAIFDNAWVDLIFIFCSWGWQNPLVRPQYDDEYITILITAGDKSHPLLSSAITPRATGHYIIVLVIHSGISKGPLYALVCHLDDSHWRKFWSLPKRTSFWRGALVV